MSFFKKLDFYNNYKAKHDESSPQFKRRMAGHIDKRRLRYVCERVTKDGKIEEFVVAREGFIHLNKDEQITVVCDGKNVFRADIYGLKMAELLSLEGVILEGLDLESGRQRVIVAFYVYYRK
jgi:hypothetical protein